MQHPQAREFVYRGYLLMGRMTRADMEEARRLFQEAAELVPESPLPYVFAAWTHYLDIERGWSSSRERSLAQMGSLTRKSVERSDQSGMSDMMLGYAHLLREEHNQALEYSEKSVVERPSCPTAFSMRANILNYCGQPEAAIEPAKTAIRLSPLAQTMYPEVLAFSHFLCGRLEEALETAHSTLALAPDSVDSRVVLAASLVEAGRLASAREVVEDIVAIDPMFDLNRFKASHYFFRDPETINRFLEDLKVAGADESRVNAPQVALSGKSRLRVAPQPKR